MTQPRSLTEYRVDLYGSAETDRTLGVRGWLFLALLVLLVLTVGLYVAGYLPGLYHR